MINYEELYLLPALLKAHGTIMGIAFVVILPLGAAFVRLFHSKHALWIHVTVQLLGWVMMLAGFGLGIKTGSIIDILYKNTHTTLGTVVVVLLIFQPLIGLIHHLRYKKTQRRGIWTLVHRWYGRALILLGMINGGLGLRLAHNTTGGTITYGVVAGISGCAFVGLIAWSEKQESVSEQSRRASSNDAVEPDPKRNKGTA